MSTRFYFDLKAVTDRAQHAIVADRNASTQQDLDLGVPAQPALWFYRCEGYVRLCSNGTTPSFGATASRCRSQRSPARCRLRSYARRTS
jgi:hypothetical protein